MKKSFLSLLCAVLAFAGMAQDSLDYRLYDFVFSASRWCQDSESQPVKVSRISFEEANAFNPQTAADLLGLNGDVFIQKSQYGGGRTLFPLFNLITKIKRNKKCIEI